MVVFYILLLSRLGEIISELENIMADFRKDVFLAIVIFFSFVSLSHARCWPPGYEIPPNCEYFGSMNSDDENVSTAELQKGLCALNYSEQRFSGIIVGDFTVDGVSGPVTGQTVQLFLEQVEELYEDFSIDDRVAFQERNTLLSEANLQTFSKVKRLILGGSNYSSDDRKKICTLVFSAFSRPPLGTPHTPGSTDLKSQGLTILEPQFSINLGGENNRRDVYVVFSVGEHNNVFLGIAETEVKTDEWVECFDKGFDCEPKKVMDIERLNGAQGGILIDDIPDFLEFEAFRWEEKFREPSGTSPRVSAVPRLMYVSEWKRLVEIEFGDSLKRGGEECLSALKRYYSKIKKERNYNFFSNFIGNLIEPVLSANNQGRWTGGAQIPTIDSICASEDPIQYLLDKSVQISRIPGMQGMLGLRVAAVFVVR